MDHRTLTSEMPVVGLLCTVAELSGRSMVALLTLTTGPLVESSVATPAATLTRVPVPPLAFSAPLPITNNPPVPPPE